MFVIDIARTITGAAHASAAIAMLAIFLSPFILLAGLIKSLYITLLSPYFLIPIFAVGFMIASIWLFKNRKTHKNKYLGTALMSCVFMFCSAYFATQMNKEDAASAKRAEMMVAALHRDYVLSYELHQLWPQEMRDWQDTLELSTGSAPPVEGSSIGTRYDMHNQREAKNTWYKVKPANAIEVYYDLADQHGDWLAFSNDCLRSKYQKGTRASRAETCKDWERIKATYQIDMPVLMSVYLKSKELSMSECGKDKFLCARMEQETGLTFPIVQ